MQLEDFIIETPEDLQLFADMLNDYGHPGEEIVRWLIAERRWPIAVRHDKVYWFSEASSVWFRTMADAGMEHWLPFDTLPLALNYYSSITESVWAIIEHKERTKCTSTLSPRLRNAAGMWASSIQ